MATSSFGKENLKSINFPDLAKYGSIALLSLCTAAGPMAIAGASDNQIDIPTPTIVPTAESTPEPTPQVAAEATEEATAVDVSQLKYVVEGLPLGELDIVKMQTENPELYKKFLATPGVEGQMFNDANNDQFEIGFMQLVVPKEGAVTEQMGDLSIVWLLEPAKDTTGQITGWKKVGVVYKNNESQTCEFHTVRVLDAKKQPSIVTQSSSFLLDTVLEPNETVLLSYQKVDPTMDPNSVACSQIVRALISKDINVKAPIVFTYSGN